MKYRDIITIEPEKRGGKPCVRGLRITVYQVLEYLASEMTEAEIQGRFSRSDARRFKSLHCLCCRSWASVYECPIIPMKLLFDENLLPKLPIRTRH